MALEKQDYDDDCDIDDFLLVDMEELEPDTDDGLFSRMMSWLPFWSKSPVPQVPQVLPEDFTSATKLRIYIREIIAEFGECRSVKSKSEMIHTFLLKLYSYHPTRPTNIIDFAIVRGSYGNLHFSLLKPTTTQSLSWLVCVTNIPKFIGNRKPNPAAAKRRQLASAMRTAVIYQTNKLKTSSAVFTCATCNITGTQSSDFHVDHIYPFCKLMDEFLATWSGQMPERFEYNNGRIQISVMDRPFELAWAEFHNSRAKLQLLCKPCNLSKGKKII